MHVEHNSNTYIDYSGGRMRNHLIWKQKLREGFINQNIDALLAYAIMYVYITRIVNVRYLTGGSVPQFTTTLHNYLKCPSS